MRYTDIAIIGAGLAGSTAAAMLGRAEIATILVDPHAIYPPDFRVEKLGGGEQVERFHKTGLGEAILRKTTVAEETWIARFGYLLDKAPRQQFGIMYDTLVNAIRTEIPARSRPSLPRRCRSRPAATARGLCFPTMKPSRRGSSSSPMGSMSVCARCSASNAV
jgi:2-polyprenyl-6-methoxyphenol hydroxylase-like FAD-dependent oxidoreductase